MSEIQPRLWSDFDGTAVEKLSKKNPWQWRRNLLKTKLKGLPGYGSFLQGVESVGVEIAGVVSRRPEVWPRRGNTMRSIAELGIGNYFDAAKVVLTGSEEAKGQFVLEQSRISTIGMLEDKPHKLGAVLLGALTEPAQHLEVPRHPILLGVVSHSRSQEYIERLVEQADAKTIGGLHVTESSCGGGRATSTSFRLETEFLNLHVTPLQPYSEQAGEAFGRAILDIAA